MRVKTMAILLALAVSLVGAGPALATWVWVGENIDIHQNKHVPVNDFHLEGTITSASGGVPTLQYTIDDLFYPNPASSITPLGGGAYKFTIDWLSPIDIPYCTELHLGAFFLVNDHNVMIDKKGWWTYNGQPVGNWPAVGFSVPDNRTFTLQGANVPVTVQYLDFIRLQWPGDPRAMFNQLNAAQSDNLGTWSRAINSPMSLPAESFFDIFFDVYVGPTIPGDFLLTRVFAEWPDEPAGRWFFEVHQSAPLPGAVWLLGGGLAALAALRRWRA